MKRISSISIFLFTLFTFYFSFNSFSQVTSNSGAVMAIVSGAEISNVSDLNNTSGTIENNGIFTTTGTITNGGTLSGNGTLNVAGNFINNGTVTPNSGTIIFNGTSTLSGSTILTTFNNLIVNNPNTLNIAVGKQVTTQGTLTNNGILTLKSDPTGTASFIDNGIAGTGAYNCEQYITGARWWYLSSPMSNEQTDVFDAINTVDNGIFTFDEPTNAYVRITNNTANLNPAQGYATKFKNIVSKTLLFQGIFNTGVKSLALTGSSQYWNLAGNPYPSAIDWEAASGWTKTNVRADIYYRSNGTYATYNATSHIGTNGGTQYIPAMQAFWVKCTAATGTLAMTNSIRVHDPQALLRHGDPPNTFRVSADLNGNKDEAVIAFNAVATDNFDNYDSEKMFGGDNTFPQLYVTLLGNKKTGIDVMNTFSTDRDIPLGFKAGMAGIYTLTFASLETFDANANFFLEDKLSKTIIDLKATPTYSFSSGIADNNTRFIIHFKAPSSLPVTLLNFNAVFENKIVNINWTTSSEINNAVFEVERSKDANYFESLIIKQGKGFSNSLQSYLTLDEDPYSGTSYYRLKQTDFDGNFSYSPIIQVSIPLNKQDLIKNMNVTENSLSFDIDESITNNLNIQIIDNTGNIVFSEAHGNNSHSVNINIRQLAKSTYILRIVSNSDSFIERFFKQ